MKYLVSMDMSYIVCTIEDGVHMLPASTNTHRLGMEIEAENIEECEVKISQLLQRINHVDV